MSDTPTFEALRLELADDGIPILRGVIVRAEWVIDSDDPDRDYLAGIIKVPCPYCKSPRGSQLTHTHVWNLAHGEDATTHRAAHCFTQTPLMATGYYIGLNLSPDAAHAVEVGRMQFRPTLRRMAGGIVR